MGVGSRRSMGKRAEADQNTSEELQSGREADRMWLQLVHCTIVHTVFYFGKLIRQKRKQGGTEVNIQTGDTGGNNQIYILTMCFIWNKSGKMGNGEHVKNYMK